MCRCRDSFFCYAFGAHRSTSLNGEGTQAGRAAMSDTTTSFSDVLRRLRSAASLSQEELAERAGLSRRGISDLERGARHAPHLETVRLLADALKLAASDRVALYAAARPALLAASVLTPAAAPRGAVPARLPPW